jgi:predicted transcriptional regulator
MTWLDTSAKMANVLTKLLSCGKSVGEIAKVAFEGVALLKMANN